MDNPYGIDWLLFRYHLPGPISLDMWNWLRACERIIRKESDERLTAQIQAAQCYGKSPALNIDMEGLNDNN